MEQSGALSRSVVLGHENGLHLTPITALVQCTTQFEAEVTLSFNGKSASAKSAVELMLLGATHGSLIAVEAEGVDAEQAIDATSEILEAR